MYRYENIRTVHLELSELCNAACPMCPRNILGESVNPHITQTQLYLSDIETIFKPKFVSQLDKIYLCGNFGDPIIAKDTQPVLQYFRTNNPHMILGMHTNGSAQSVNWWKNLPTILGKNHYVAFGLDGLADTNHLYRRHTNWSKIMENVSAFIENGGRARWDFLVFAHNEHQVEAARSLAKSMGFESFITKKTSRFYKLTQKSIDTINIQIPTNIKYQNAVVNEIGNMIPSMLVEKEIDCKAVKDASIYVSAEGYVLPCCWTGAQMYTPAKSFRQAEVWQYIDQVGLDSLDGKIHDIQNIINGKFFQEVIPNGWKGKQLNVCAHNCNKKFDYFSAQFQKELLK